MPTVIFTMLQLWAGSLLARLLIGGGLTLLIGAAIDVSISSLLTTAVASIGGLPQISLQIFLLSGISTVLSIIGGALLTKAAMSTAGKVMGVKLNGAGQ